MREEQAKKDEKFVHEKRKKVENFLRKFSFSSEGEVSFQCEKKTEKIWKTSKSSLSLFLSSEMK